MNINTMVRYKVKCKGKYYYNTPDLDSENNWHTEKFCWQRTMYGRELLNFIAEKLKDNLYEFHIEDNTIYLGYFNSQSGEGSDYTYTISLAPLKKNQRS